MGKPGGCRMTTFLWNLSDARHELELCTSASVASSSQRAWITHAIVMATCLWCHGGRWWTGYIMLLRSILCSFFVLSHLCPCMDSDPSSFSLTLFGPFQPSTHNNAGAMPTHSVARLSLGPGRLANHLLTTDERHLEWIVGYVWW